MVRSRLMDGSASEEAWQGTVLQYAELRGWMYYHTRRSDHSPRGFPDLVMGRPPRLLFIELKAERGKVSDEQRAWLQLLAACGQETRVWRPSDWTEVEATLR